MNDERTQIFEAQAATVFTMGGFGASKREVRNVKVETGKYAQYDKAYFVTFTEKGKRKAVCNVLYYKPFLLITRASVSLTPDDPFTPVETSVPGVSVKRTRFSSFDPAYEAEFKTKAKTFAAANPGMVLFSLGFEEATAVKAEA